MVQKKDGEPKGWREQARRWRVGVSDNKPVPLPTELKTKGDAKELLDFVVSKFPNRSQTTDLLKETLVERRIEPAIEYVFLPQVKDLREFVGEDRRNKTFLLIHPESHGQRFVSIARSDDDDGLVGWSYSNWDQLWRGSNCPAVNFTLIHGEGYDHEVWEKLCKSKGVHWIGSQQALDIVVEGKVVKPKDSRKGESGTSDATLVATIPICEVTDRGKLGNAIVNANWPKGWQVFGLINVSSKSREQVRQYEKERTPMTHEEIKNQINSERYFLSQYKASLAGYQEPGSYPALKGYEKRLKIDGYELKIIDQEERIKRLEVSLKNPNLPITPADLNIEIFA